MRLNFTSNIGYSFLDQRSLVIERPETFLLTLQAELFKMRLNIFSRLTAVGYILAVT